MLRGRESLVRLVGKRRRFLPNRRFPLLHAPILQTSLNLCSDHDDDKIVDANYVTCPVCTTTVNGEHSIINSHLDACLSRGTKRKSTQTTLLQLNNFFSPSKLHHKHQSCDQNEEIILESAAVHPQRDCLLATLNDASTSNTMLTTNDMILQTFIVGRKFSDQKDLSLPQTIYLQRDPTNVKDPNAIKVISADSGCSKMLGFLPRELAKFLSPLIDKYCLSFKGFVTTAPRSSVDIVPIEVTCDNIKLLDEKNCDVEEFKDLWTSVQQAIDSMKNFTPNALKYQKNFCLLIQEVLQGYSHLLSDDENHFLGIRSK